MNSDIIEDAFKQTLKSLDGFSKWFLSIAVVVWWAGLSESKASIKIIGIEILRQQAFAVIGVIYFILNFAFLYKIKRLHFLIQSVEDEKKVNIITLLFVHEWLLNPFGLYDYYNNKNIFSIIQRSLLVIIWWLCNMSLFCLFKSFDFPTLTKFLVYFLVLGLFLIIGVFCLLEITSIANTLYSLKENIQDEDIKKRLTFLYSIIKPSLSIGVLFGFALTFIIIYVLS